MSKHVHKWGRIGPGDSDWQCTHGVAYEGVFGIGCCAHEPIIAMCTATDYCAAARCKEHSPFPKRKPPTPRKRRKSR